MSLLRRLFKAAPTYDAVVTKKSSEVVLLLPRFLFSGQVCHGGKWRQVAQPINIWVRGFWLSVLKCWPPGSPSPFSCIGLPQAVGTDPNVQWLKRIVNTARITCEIQTRMRNHKLEKYLLTWDTHAKWRSEKQASKKTYKSIQFQLNLSHVNLKYFDVGFLKSKFYSLCKLEIIGHSKWKISFEACRPREL